MNKHHILDEFRFNTRKKTALLIVKLFFLILIVTGFGVYVGDLLFGKNSLEILLNLQDKKALFKKEIKQYKQENATLQKNYFELLQLEPDN